MHGRAGGIPGADSYPFPMTRFVPEDFDVPLTYSGPGFQLEPLGPGHNERDHDAWMGSIDHIRSTPGMDWQKWPTPMTLEDNLADMVMHAAEFRDRVGFTYSILDDADVIGCVYIYPSKDPSFDAKVRSWVTESRGEMDAVIWSDLSRWLTSEWPFRNIDYAARVASR